MNMEKKINPKLSIVTTLFNSENYIDEFYSLINSESKKVIKGDYEIIFVNDGSKDKSYKIAKSLCKQNSNVTLVDLSKNFGHHKAIMTGLKYCTGDYIFLLDSDLEERPEWLSLFYKKMENENVDVVYGIQEKRNDSHISNTFAKLFYFLFNSLSNTQIPKNFLIARLMKRKYVESLLLHNEKEIFIGGMFHLIGFNQVGLEVNKMKQNTSSYSFFKKMSHLINSITSFSILPLVSIFYSGLILLLISGFFIVYFIFNKIFFGIPVSGWTSMIVSIFFLGGLNIFFIGLIGIYLSKMFLEVKSRPLTIVREVIGKKAVNFTSQNYENL